MMYDVLITRSIQHNHCVRWGISSGDAVREIFACTPKVSQSFLCDGRNKLNRTGKCRLRSLSQHFGKRKHRGESPAIVTNSRTACARTDRNRGERRVLLENSVQMRHTNHGREPWCSFRMWETCDDIACAVQTR